LVEVTGGIVRSGLFTEMISTTFGQVSVFEVREVQGRGNDVTDPARGGGGVPQFSIAR
jgi:hypothetical protein